MVTDQAVSLSHLAQVPSKVNAAGAALVYSTYLGGNQNSFGNVGNSIAVDNNGDAYVTGLTSSSNFPTTVGAFQTTEHDHSSAYITKLNPNGNGLVYSSYLSGDNDQEGYAIAVDASDHAYVTGGTSSSIFPTTAGAFEPTRTAGCCGDEVFVTKFNTTGSALAYSTYLGGAGGEDSYGIAVDSSGNAYVTGATNDAAFPTANAFQATFHGTGSTTDAFVTKFNAAGSALDYSTYLGGSGTDQANAIAVDAFGEAYVTGYTYSTDFPTQNPFQPTLNSYPGAFVTKFSSAGNSLIYSTFLGGSGDDQGQGIALGAFGDAYVVGYTDSSDFPLANPVEVKNPDYGSAFVTKFNTFGSALLFSTDLGGDPAPGARDWGYAIAVDGLGDTYVTGITNSADFPTTAGAAQATYGGNGDAFVTKMSPWADTTTGVFRPSNGVLYLKNANTTGPADIALNYGLPGDQPITGDWTGKGYPSIGIYRNGTFYLRNSNTTGYADIVVSFGASTDIPVAGDWTGKGYDSIGVYRPSNSTFYLRDSNTSGPPNHIVTLGISGDVPITGDWTAKGFDSVGVFRPSNGIVYMRNSNTTGYADIAFTYGIAGDKPVVGDWTGQGFDTIGVDRGGHFLLRNTNTTGPANLNFYLGVSSDDPIAGPWLAPASAPPPVHRGPRTPATQTATTPTRRIAKQR